MLPLAVRTSVFGRSHYSLGEAAITLSTSCQSISIYLGPMASRIPTSIVRLSVPILAYATSC